MSQADMSRGEFDQPEFLARLRAGDPAAFRALVTRFHVSLTRVAASVIGSRAQAEEVVQDAWLAVFSGIARFEGRSSVITWIFTIVMNRARTRAAREGRLTGLPAVLDGAEPGERAVPLAAFKPDGHWLAPPKLWDELDPERVVGGRQLWQHALDAVDALPAGQRAVIVLRDLEGRTAEEACVILQITPENQRVLLHRARGRLRRVLDGLAGEAPGKDPATAAVRTRKGNTGGAPVRRMIRRNATAVMKYLVGLPRRAHRTFPSRPGLAGPSTPVLPSRTEPGMTRTGSLPSSQSGQSVLVDRFCVSMLESVVILKKDKGRCRA